MEAKNEFMLSAVESDRFGLKVFRSKTKAIDLKSLKNAILEESADLVILRVPTDTKGSHHKIFDIGFPVIHCDTLVYYACSLKTHVEKNLKNEIIFEVINDQNSDILDSLIPTIFQEYKNHYYSNPILNKGKVLEGYIEWAKSYSKAQNSSKISWVAKLEGEICGFATCSFDEENKDCEGILYGVHPDFAGKGIYSDLIKFTQSYFRKQGMIRMLVSTQIQNIGVQKVWNREGFNLQESWDTYHINSLLNHTEKIVPEIEYSISSEEVKKFADFSGDFNELHFSDEYAIETGFREGRISHGMIASSFLSKFFGVEFPGTGTLILNYRCNYYSPIYPDHNYVCKISFPIINSNGFFKAVCTFKDLDSKICSVYYFDLLNRSK